MRSWTCNFNLFGKELAEQTLVDNMKLSVKDLIKLIAPYLVAIGGVIGVYADGKSRFELMEYRVQVVEKDKDDLRNDLKSIKDVLYRIDTRLSVFGAQLEERTGR